MKKSFLLFLLGLIQVSFINASSATTAATPCSPYIKTALADCHLEIIDLPVEQKKCALIKVYEEPHAGYYLVKNTAQSRNQVTTAFWKKKSTQVIGICVINGEVSHANLL